MTLVVKFHPTTSEAQPTTNTHSTQLSARKLKLHTTMQKLVHRNLEIYSFDVRNYLVADNCHVVIKHISKEAN